MTDAENRCPGEEYVERKLDYEEEGRLLYRCTTCGRVNRTKRRHRKPGRTTQSRDNTLNILWDSAKPVDSTKAKVAMTLLGYIEGMHTTLDGLRPSDGPHDSQDPLHHNVEQAQIALENASFRIHQVFMHLTTTKEERLGG